MSTITPNMNLLEPVVGSTPGPDWASDLNSSLTLIDQHDHTPGKGVPITPSGISINADLSFGSNNATSLRSSRYTPQASPLALATDLGATYVSGADLYYNDTAGNQVRLTSGGAPAGGAGTITGLPNGVASATYSSNTFTFQGGVTGIPIPATIDVGPVIVRDQVASGKGVTLQTVTSLASNYTIILPQLPISQKIMTLDASGNMTAPYTVDGSTIAIAANIIGVPANGIGTTQLNTAAVTGPKIAAGAVDTSNLATNAVTTVKITDGNVTPIKLSTAVQGANTSSSITTSASGTVTITKSGRPVLICVSMDNPGSSIIGQPTIVGSTTGQLLVSRAGVQVKDIRTVTTSAINFDSWQWIDTSGGTGSTTYGLITSAGTVTMNGAMVLRISIMEL